MIFKAWLCMAKSDWSIWSVSANHWSPYKTPLRKDFRSASCAVMKYYYLRHKLGYFFNGNQSQLISLITWRMQTNQWLRRWCVMQMESFIHLMKATKYTDTFIACGREGIIREMQFNPVLKVRARARRRSLRPGSTWQPSGECRLLPTINRFT